MSRGKRHGTGTGTAAPAEWQRPEFAAGNTVAVRSGARAPRVYGELAEHLAAGLTEDRPDLARYPEAVAAWATAEAQAALMRRHVAEAGWLNPETGEPREGVMRWLGAFERLAAKHRDTLGLDPRSEAALARERAAAAVLAVDLDGLAARGRAALAGREAAGIEPPPDVVGDVLNKVRAQGAEVMAEATRRHHEAAAEATNGLSHPHPQTSQEAQR